jgi:hypothetical protein
MAKKDYYVILGVPRSESSVGIHEAFRKLAKKYHPDLGGPETAETFREIAHAYEILSDPEQRRTYDQTLRREEGSFRPEPRGQMGRPQRYKPEPLVPRPKPVFSDFQRARPSVEALFDRMLIRCLVLAHSFPVNGLGSSARMRIFLRDPGVLLLGLRPLLAHERVSRQTHFQAGPEFGIREIALASLSLDAVSVQDQHGRRPQRAEAMEIGRLLFDMRLNCDKILVDENGGCVVRIGFGFQPNASASRGRRAKIDHSGLFCTFAFVSARSTSWFQFTAMFFPFLL